MNGVDKQKAHLEKLSKVIFSPIYTSRNKRDNDSFRPGFQKLLGQYIPPIDHRSIGSNEIVIELDAKAFSNNAMFASRILEYTRSQNIPAYAFWSGNKSIHIHIFIDNLNISDKGLQEKIKEAVSKGMNVWKEIRMNIVREIVGESGIHSDQIGFGKLVDLAKLSWDDVHSRSPLIRCCGGANKKVEKLTGNIKTAFKGYLVAIPPQKPREGSTPFNFDDVVYPSKIEMYQISEVMVAQIVEDWLDLNEKLPSHKIGSEFTGKYINLPCIKTIREGMPSGKRAFSSQQIAIACRLDGKNPKETEKIFSEFVQNCPQTPTTPFTLDEARKWMKWVEKLPQPYFACGQCVKLGVCERHSCPLHTEQYKEANDFVLKDGDPLAVVKTVLDKTIVGEDHLKIQLFLIFLSKSLNPDWCVIVDGEASSGKSFIMKEVVKLFGEERSDYFIYSRITAAVLNHIDDLVKEWNDSIVIIEEFQGAEPALQQLRVLISERGLNALSTEEGKVDGMKKHVAKEHYIKLHNTLFATCQAETEDEGDQFRSRAWILNTDESSKQTQKIKKFKLNRKTKLPVGVGDDVENIKSYIKSLLTFDCILFPFANELDQFLSSTNVRVRRDIDKILSAIDASALFHQHDRVKVKHKGKSYLIADWRDVKVMKDWFWDTIVATTQGLGEKEYQHLKTLRSHVISKARGSDIHGIDVSLDDVKTWLGLGSSVSARKIINNLMKSGFVENVVRPPEQARYRFFNIPVYSKIIDLDWAEKLNENEVLVADFVKKEFGDDNNV